MDMPDNDDKSLWEAALDGVTPIEQPARHKRSPAQVHGAIKFAEDESQVMPNAMADFIEPDELDAGDETEFRAAGVSRQQLRKLRRGEFSIQATADLHGMTRVEAANRVRKLLEDAEHRGWRCIKIIHGKGLRSPNGLPVLKSRVETALRRSERVLGYATAPPWSGGHGATLVLLRQR